MDFPRCLHKVVPFINEDKEQNLLILGGKSGEVYSFGAVYSLN